jgi:hypothetical protein
MQPPLLPQETLRRVLRIAHFDGMSVLVIAGVFGLLSAWAGDYLGAVIGLLVAGAGAIELHGETLLRGWSPRGMNWLIGSQLFLMVAMLGYCALRLTHVVLPPIPPQLETMIETTAEQLGLTKDEYMLFVYRLGFQVIAGLTVLYQGGMAFYYLRRRAVVAQALAEVDIADANAT